MRFKILYLFSICSFLFAIFVDESLAQSSNGAKQDTTTIEQIKQSNDPWLGKDKLDHLIVSSALTGFQYYTLHKEMDMSHKTSLQLAITGTLIVGVAKEVYDDITHKGTASIKDIAADVLGIAVAAFVLTR